MIEASNWSEYQPQQQVKMDRIDNQIEKMWCVTCKDSFGLARRMT